VTDNSSGMRSAGLDTSVSHSARVWNYWLGGKDNFAIDRQVGDQIAGILPSIVALARADRAFLGRVIRYLAGVAGIRQFLDIGTGLPSADNTHEVAQRIAPDSRIVYVDNDPLVLVHARALLTGTPQGATAYVEADLNDPVRILHEARQTLDFHQPIAVTLLGVLHFVLNDFRAREVIRQLLEPMPSGSYLVLAHFCHDVNPVEVKEAAAFWNEHGKPPITYRSAAQIAQFFDGMELLEPGVVSCSRWRPDPADPAGPVVNQFCGVGRKP
jgi:hypothetical protein